MTFDPGDFMRRVIDERIRRGLLSVRQTGKAQIDPAYASGDPKVQRPGESFAGNIVIRHIAAYSMKVMAANDSVATSSMGDGTVINGAIASVGAPGLITAATLAQLLAFSMPVVAGNTFTLQTATTERSVFGDVFTDVKEIRLGGPGRYRAALQLARSGAAAPEVKLEVKMPDGRRVAASSTISSPSAVHPTFGATVNLDMNVTAPMNANLFVMLRSQSSGQTAYITNAVIKFDTATIAPAIHSAVIVD